MKQQKQKTDYYNTIRNLVTAAHTRHGILTGNLSPCLGDSTPDDVDKFLAIEKAIEKSCQRMKDMEAGADFGVQVLLGKDVPDVIRIAVCILTAGVLTGEVGLSDVAYLGEMAAGRNPEGLILVHEAFAKNGILRQHCDAICRASTVNLGQLSHPTLKESSFRTVLGLPVNTEFEDLAKALEITKKV